MDNYQWAYEKGSGKASIIVPPRTTISASWRSDSYELGIEIPDRKIAFSIAHYFCEELCEDEKLVYFGRENQSGYLLQHAKIIREASGLPLEHVRRISKLLDLLAC